jgi:hypothetical protein
MKEKKLKSINPIKGALLTIQAQADLILGKPREWRNDFFRLETEEFIVDTCVPFDTNMWETGISQDNEASWTIVEQYKDKEEAEIGHAKWCELLKADPQKELEDINLWDL